LGDIRYWANRDRVILADAALHADDARTTKRLKEFEANRQSAVKEWQDYMATYLTEEEQGLAKAAGSAVSTYVDGGLKPVAQALAQHHYQDAAGLLDTAVSPSSPAMQEASDKLIALQARVAGEVF
jgi:hypothetical protein